VQALEFYFSDVWRVRPTLTLTYGLSYQWQTPPTEEDRKQSFMINNENGEILSSGVYFNARRQAAERGEIFNPQLGFQPIANSSRKHVFDIVGRNIGPRVALAWNPSFSSGFLGRVFGKGKAALRGGYSILYDRLNTASTMMGSTGGLGFFTTLTCLGPVMGGRCANSNDPSNAFRVGEGPTPLPDFPVAEAPIVPNIVFEEFQSMLVDPDIKVGRSHSLNFTIQRELPWDNLVELGYVGRLGRNLPRGIQFNSVPYFMKDAASDQTFAQAFDAVAAELRQGVAHGDVTPQPWFENQFPVGTAGIAKTQTAAFLNGELNNLFFAIDRARLSNGMLPINNLQVMNLYMLTDGGRSNYHSFFATLRKRFSRGLSFDLNYTLSRLLDQAGRPQMSIRTYSSSFSPDIDYGPGRWDRSHVLNAFWLYEPPFGPGRRWGAGNALDRILGGWFASGIVTASSGRPLSVVQSNQVWGGAFPLFNWSMAAGAIPIAKPDFGNNVNHGVKGSNGIGTTGNPASGGSGLNLFGDPEAVLKGFRKIRISEDGRHGRGVLRGLPRWNVDLSVGKRMILGEDIRMLFTADFINLFNHVEFSDPSLRLQNPADFGVLSQQYNYPRAIQFGLRIEW
jgi:hypothetical protein